MAPPALGPEIYGLGFRFNPTPQEAVTYYLPRLVAGDPRALHAAVRPVIHRVQVYACDPADLARRFRPMPRTHNRFFFTVAKKGVRAAGAGCWSGQNSAPINDKEGVKIGDLRKFRYKKGGDLTDWLMEEYSSSELDGAAGAGMDFVLCRVYVSPMAEPDSNAYKESAACFAPPPPAAPAVFTQSVAARRPAPPPAAPAVITQPVAARRPAPPPAAPAVFTQPVAARRPAPPPAAPAVFTQPVVARRPAPPPAAPAVFTQPVVAKRPGPPPAVPAVFTQPMVAKRPAPPPQDLMPPCAKRMWVPAVQPAPPPQPPAPPADARKMPLAPPQPSAPRRGSTPQPSPVSAPPPAPPAPTTSHLAATRKMPFAPPQPCAPRRGLPAASVTRPSPAPIHAPALPVPIRPAVEARRLPMPAPPPPRPLAQRKEQVPLPAPPVMRASLPKQRRILDPFEATMLRDEAEVQTVAAAPHLPEPPAAAPALQDDDDGLVKAMSTAEAEEQTMPSALQDEDEDCWDDLDKEIEDALRTAEADDEESVTAAPATLQDDDDDDDDFAKVMEEMLSAEAEDPAVAAPEFDVDAFFNFSEEMLSSS